MSISNKDTTVDVLCKLLKTWGQCSDDVIEYMRSSDDDTINPTKLL